MPTYFNTTQGKTTHLKVYISDRDVYTGDLLAKRILVLQLEDHDGYIIKFPINKWLSNLVLQLLEEINANTN